MLQAAQGVLLLKDKPLNAFSLNNLETVMETLELAALELYCKSCTTLCKSECAQQCSVQLVDGTPGSTAVE